MQDDQDQSTDQTPESGQSQTSSEYVKPFSEGLGKEGLLQEAVKANRKTNPSDLRRDSLLGAIGRYNEEQRGKPKFKKVRAKRGPV